MAEVRKFNPAKGGSIAEQVAKAMGESVRPTTPGAPPAKKQPVKPAAPTYDIFTTTTSAFTVKPKAEPENR